MELVDREAREVEEGGSFVRGEGEAKLLSGVDRILLKKPLLLVV